MKNSMMKNLTMFILCTLAVVVLFAISLFLAIAIDLMIYIGTTLCVITAIFYIYIFVWSPLSPFCKLIFDNQGFSITHFKEIKDRINWNELSNISYEYQGRVGFYTFTFKTKRKSISIVYEKKLQELILLYCSDQHLLEVIKNEICKINISKTNMIEYSFDKTKNNLRINEIVLSQIKPCLIIALVFVPLAIYFILIGYLFDKELLINGYSSLFITIFMSIVSIVNYINIKKEINANLNISDKDDITYTVDKDGNKYKIECVDNKKSIEFTKQEIKKIYQTKHLIIIKLKSKKIIDLPKEKEIIELFK